MKKLFFILISGCLFVFHTNAQDLKHNLKLNVLSLLAVNISLQDEYTLNDNSSVCLGFSYLPTRKIITNGVPSDREVEIEDLSFGGFAITPEYRYYFSGKNPKGFYAAGYFRYSKYSTSEAEYKFKRDDGTYEPVKISGDYTSTGVGIMFGCQWLLGERMTLDWWILGAAFGSQKGEYKGTGNFDADDQQDVKDSFEDINVVGIDASVETSSTQMDVTVKNNWPAIRAFGLCVGYRF